MYKGGNKIMKPVLEAKQLSKRYPGSSAPALDSVTFSVDRGEFVGIMGASGSGKTTLLNVLSTIDRPTSGEILISGVSLGTLNDSRGADFRKDRLGFIFQEYFLLDSLTIRENISVPLALKKIPAKRIASAVQRLAERFGIAAQLDKYPSELSGGQRQRASAARAIIKRPDILFADEPTGALDSASSTELLNTLSEANRKLQTTILMVTHDAYAASFADRILIFRDGHIVSELFRGGDRQDFYHDITSETARLDRLRTQPREHV